MDGKDPALKRRGVRRAPPVPGERGETLRREIAQLLRHFGPLSGREISSEVGIREREVPGHLEHIRLSLARTGERLVVTPPKCRRCGYVFEKRKRLTKPGKCPECRGTSMDEPLFRIG